MAELGFLSKLPKILFLGKNSQVGLLKGDDSSLASSAASMGYEVIEDITETPDITVSVDYVKSQASLVRHLKEAGSMQVLVKQEPYVVLPEHREPNPGSLFDLVLSRGIPNSVTLNYPNSWDKALDWKSPRNSRFVAITANKWSAISGQLYSLRNAVYSKSELIDLYGQSWDRTKSKNLEMIAKELLIAVGHRVWPSFPNMGDWSPKPFRYLGPVEDKGATLARYDFSVVIENSGHYMSEKLMDSLLAGNVPVYVGANTEHFDIPPQFVFQAEPNFDSVLEKMEQARRVNVIGHRKEVNDWLSSPEVEEAWKARNVNRTLMEKILFGFKVHAQRVNSSDKKLKPE